LALQSIAQLLQLLQDLLALRIGGGLEAVHELAPLLLELLQEGLHIPGRVVGGARPGGIIPYLLVAALGGGAVFVNAV
jgi:hypothetical protein